jgi:ABC-2 type transport system permease protein
MTVLPPATEPPGLGPTGAQSPAPTVESSVPNRSTPATTGPPTAAGPGQAAAFGAVYGVLLRSVATKGRLAAIGALAIISILTALGVNASSPFDPLGAATGYVNANLSTLVPVAVLVFGAATLGDLVDDGTLVYLWLRPVPARVHVLAAWAATVTITLPLVGGPLLLATALIEADGPLLAATVLGVLVGISAYSALFVMAGIRFRRALPWGLVYILIWEGFVASAGETAARLAIRSYVRSILAQLTDQSIKLAEFNLASAILVPLAVTVVALAYACRRLARTDVA